MLAYHGQSIIKADLLAQLAAHRKADEIVKGQYWENGKGCAVGCTIHSENHVEYETRFGIPRMIAHLEDCIFEGLPSKKAKEWPERFSSVIIPGADLSLVGWKFLHWILTDEAVNPGINHSIVRDAVRQCADVIAALAKGWVAESAASAESAAWSAESAAAIAASAAERAAARSAASAASAAWSAAWSAESAESAAWSAESAESAAWSAESAAWSAESADYILMADKLCELLAEA